MKIKIIFILSLTLLLSSCKSMSEETVETYNAAIITGIPEDDYSAFSIPVDKDRVIISHEVSANDYLTLSEAPLNSFAVVQTQSYEKWTRAYAVYYPLFTDEIEYAGREAINDYYAKRSEKEQDNLRYF